jgi:hypothetical protein
MILLALFAALFPALQSQGRPDESVAKLLFFGFCADAPQSIGAPTPDVAARLDAFANRCERFKAAHPAPQANSGEGMAANARWMYEGRLFAVARRDGAESEAVQYVQALRPCYEWEGYHDCPEREAAFADRYLRAHPASGFADYLPLLAAHRWQCAAEAYEYEARNHVPLARDSVGLAEARRRSLADLATALRSGDPLVRSAAEFLKRSHACF